MASKGQRPTVEEVRDLLDYDPATGAFTWRTTRPGRGCQAGKPAGAVTGNGLYRRVIVNYFPILGHILAWAVVHGEWPSSILDHIDGNGFNNRIENLRLATVTQNAWNRRRRSDNKSGLKGVWRNAPSRSKAWRSSIQVNGKRICLGEYATAADAGEAYAKAARRFFGAFARCE